MNSLLKDMAAIRHQWVVVPLLQLTRRLRWNVPWLALFALALLPMALAPQGRVVVLAEVILVAVMGLCVIAAHEADRLLRNLQERWERTEEARIDEYLFGIFERLCPELSEVEAAYRFWRSREFDGCRRLSKALAYSDKVASKSKKATVYRQCMMWRYEFDYSLHALVGRLQGPS